MNIEQTNLGSAASSSDFVSLAIFAFCSRGFCSSIHAMKFHFPLANKRRGKKSTPGVQSTWQGRKVRTNDTGTPRLSELGSSAPWGAHSTMDIANNPCSINQTNILLLSLTAAHHHPHYLITFFSYHFLSRWELLVVFCSSREKACRESAAFPTRGAGARCSRALTEPGESCQGTALTSLAALAWREPSGETRDPRSMQDLSSANVGCCLGDGQVPPGVPWCRGWDSLLVLHPAWEPHSSAVWTPLPHQSGLSHSATPFHTDFLYCTLKCHVLYERHMGHSFSCVLLPSGHWLQHRLSLHMWLSSPDVPDVCKPFQHPPLPWAWCTFFHSLQADKANPYHSNTSVLVKRGTSSHGGTLV